MADHYVREMRTVQPHGPYHLVGFCSFGLLIAFEMAQQLRHQGETIALLAGLNSPTPVSDRRRVNQTDKLPQNRVSPPRGESKKPGLMATMCAPLQWAAQRIAWRILTVRKMWQNANWLWYVLLRRAVPDRARTKFFRLMNNRAELRYKIRPYPGQLVILRAQDFYLDDDMGWSAFVHSLVVHDIPGNHRRHRNLMDEPHVQVLAQMMRSHLEKMAVPNAREMEALRP
jgi:thioesterase domain-containing protein